MQNSNMNANVITSLIPCDENAAVIFFRKISVDKTLKSAILKVSALGIYEARIDGERVGEYIFAPGWTQYSKRIQYQTYDVTHMLKRESLIEIEVGTGWMRGRIAHITETQKKYPAGIIAELLIEFADGEKKYICSDETWKSKRSNVVFSDIYDGEIVDGCFVDKKDGGCRILEFDTGVFIPQEGEIIKEHERLKPVLITTPKGENVLDFGQNMTGYMESVIFSEEGECFSFDCAEELDKYGNFYNENYRSSKSSFEYTCKKGENFIKPKFTFFGFRYIRIKEHPMCEEINPENFTAVAVYSDIKQTGFINTSNKNLNRLFENIIWGQKSNYLDVPTDCPQRDERMGWTGDAQVFVHAASLNFDVEKFFTKWLKDLTAASSSEGAVPMMVPYYLEGAEEKYQKYYYENGAAWGDAATICPWEIYLTYGNKNILEEQFASMKGYVDYITSVTKDEFMFTGHHQFGDWLALDAKENGYKGSSRDDLIAHAFYAKSTELVVKAGKIIGYDVCFYEKLYKNITDKFKQVWKDQYHTQTEYALALYFGLAEDRKKTAKGLCDMVKKNNNKLTTGFVGTPYLLYALSENGYIDVAYSLLLQEEYPSWLFSVKMGATTIWEHWDGKKEDGSFWNKDMNSFNHYAYGAVADWIYTVAAGIQRVEEFPGFEKIKICPLPDKRLEYLDASVETRRGKVRSKWTFEKDFVRYEIETPSETEVIINGKSRKILPGKYMFIESVL